MATTETTPTAAAIAAEMTLSPAITEDAIAAVAAHFPKGQTRKAFEDLDSAIAALTALVSDEAVSALGLPYDIVGANPDGTIDPEVYTGSNPVLAQVRARVVVDPATGKKAEGIKAFVLFPIPTLETIIAAGDQGSEFIEKVLEKEFSLVAFRNWRDFDNADEFSAGVAAAPRNLTDYLTSQVSTVDTSTFDDLWPDFRETARKDYKDLWAMLAVLGKGNVLRAIRSKSYALANPDAKALEENGIFVQIAKQLIVFAEADEMDASALKNWIAKRDEVELSYKAPEKVEDTSFLKGFSFAQ